MSPRTLERDARAGAGGAAATWPLVQPSLSACWLRCHHGTLPPPQEQGPRTPVWTLARRVGLGPAPSASRHHPPAKASRRSRAPSRMAAPWLDVRPD